MIETEIHPPETIGDKIGVSEDVMIDVMTWAEVVTAEGEYSNPDFWIEFDEFAKHSFNKQEKVEVEVIQNDEVVGRSIIVPPASVSAERLERARETLSWQETLFALGSWGNAQWRSQLDDACYDAYMDNQPLTIKARII
jgi:hypothetical protein